MIGRLQQALATVQEGSGSRRGGPSWHITLVAELWMDWTKTEAKESRGQTTKSIASSGQTGLRLRKYISHKEHFFVFTSLFCNLILHLPTAFWLLGARLQLCSGALRNHSRKECRRNSRKGILKKGMYPLGIRYKRTGRIYPKIQTVLTFCLFIVAQQ